MGRTLTINGLYQIYKRYKEEFFPKPLKDPTVSIEDKQKIKELLTKPFNLYIRRHSAITEKSTKLKLHTLNQHCGWSIRSNLAQKYIHYFGNESSENYSRPMVLSKAIIRLIHYLLKSVQISIRRIYSKRTSQ
jgi:hypothetical protein